jgi:ribosomal-protein-alanine N-acetyltransferase
MIALRPFEEVDVPFLVEYLNDAKVTLFITGAIAQPYSLDDAQWWIKHSNCAEHIKAITYQGQFVGCISADVGLFEYNRSAELGYWIGQEYWNKGIATQAVEQFSAALINTTNIKRLFVSVVSANLASIRVLEKNDFVQEGTLKQASFKNGEFFDEHILAKTFN